MAEGWNLAKGPIQLLSTQIESIIVDIPAGIFQSLKKKGDLSQVAVVAVIYRML